VLAADLNKFSIFAHGGFEFDTPDSSVYL